MRIFLSLENLRLKVARLVMKLKAAFNIVKWHTLFVHVMWSEMSFETTYCRWEFERENWVAIKYFLVFRVLRNHRHENPLKAFPCRSMTWTEFRPLHRSKFNLNPTLLLNLNHGVIKSSWLPIKRVISGCSAIPNDERRFQTATIYPLPNQNPNKTN